MASTAQTIANIETSQVFVTITDDDGVIQQHTLALFDPQGNALNVAAQITQLKADADALCTKRRAALQALGL